MPSLSARPLVHPRSTKRRQHSNLLLLCSGTEGSTPTEGPAQHWAATKHCHGRGDPPVPPAAPQTTLACDAVHLPTAVQPARSPGALTCWLLVMLDVLHTAWDWAVLSCHTEWSYWQSVLSQIYYLPCILILRITSEKLSLSINIHKSLKCGVI